MSTSLNLNLLIKLTHWPIIQKVHYFLFTKFNCSINIQFQILFHLPSLFSPFPHGTFLHYRWIKILELEDGSPFFKQNFTSFVLLFFFFLYKFNLQDFYLFLYRNSTFIQKIYNQTYISFSYSFTITYKIFINFFL